MENKQSNKKFYWIKLKESFMTGGPLDFLMSQKNGSDYVVLYLMLCLKTTDTLGRMEHQIGEFIVPYDAERIARDCKYFKYDTVIIALELYRKLGLVYEETDGVLQISDYDSIVGSETYWAEKKRISRQKLQTEVGQCLGQSPGHCQDNSNPSISYVKNSLDNVLTMSNTMSNEKITSSYKLDNVQDSVLDNVRQEIRDKNDVIDVSKYTNTHTCARVIKRDEWKQKLMDILGDCLSFYRKEYFRVYGSDEAIDIVINTLLDFVEKESDVTIANVVYKYDDIICKLEQINNRIFEDMLFALYEKDEAYPDEKPKKKLVIDTEKFLIKILINNFAARQ